MSEVVEAYTAARLVLEAEAAMLVMVRPNDYAGAAQSPACAVKLVLDAMWQHPETAQSLADYYGAVARTRNDPTGPFSGGGQ